MNQVHPSISRLRSRSPELPMPRGSQVWAEVRRPDGTGTTVTLVEQDEGNFSASFITTVPGTYHFRVRARGVTQRGEAFTRERAVTAAVWRGGDRDSDPDRGGGAIVDYLRERDDRLCELLACLVRRGGGIGDDLERHLRAAGLDLDQLRKCLASLLPEARRPGRPCRCLSSPRRSRVRRGGGRRRSGRLRHRTPARVARMPRRPDRLLALRYAPGRGIARTLSATAAP